MELSFEKWHGLKNDFIVIYLPEHDELTFDAIIRKSPKLCARDGSGIGADGILVLHTSSDNSNFLPKKLTIINSDGSIAENCGNGLRCCAGSIYKKAQINGQLSSIENGFELELRKFKAQIRFHESLAKEVPYIEINMGTPEGETSFGNASKIRQEIKEAIEDLGLSKILGEFHLLSLSNPHVVFPVNESNQELIRKLGPALQNLQSIDGINVHTYHEDEPDRKDIANAHNHIESSISGLLKAHTWERGAGETEACGSGACCIAAFQLSDGLTERSEPIGIDMPGGRLYIKQEDQSSDIYMSGPAEYVFSGVFEI